MIVLFAVLVNGVYGAAPSSTLEHGRYLRRYPTSGNWLTMEMNGLYHVGVLLGFVREASDWRRFALSRLLSELDTQIYPDGAQIELTPGYHNVALRSFLGPVDIAGAYGYHLPDDYLARLERMFEYNMWVMRPDRDAPRWNDSWHVGRQGDHSVFERQDGRREPASDVKFPHVIQSTKRGHT